MSEGCCFVCVECPSSFHSLSLLEAHLIDSHLPQRSSHNNNHQAYRNTSSSSSSSPHHLLKMTLTLKSEELEADMEDEEEMDQSSLTNTPSPHGSEHSGSMLEDMKMISHGMMNKNECRFCHQLFENHSQLSIHYTNDHPDRRHYSCSECREVFAIKRELATHFRIHQGSTPHTCDECGKEFGTRQLLKKHCMWHSGERSHVCPHCKKAFFQKGHLTQHLMIHAGGRPHVCSLCNKTFIFKFDLNRHMKIHAERGFSCQHCGKAFARHKQLQEHSLAKCKANPNSAPSTPSVSDVERRCSLSGLMSSPPQPPPPQLITPTPILPFHSNPSLHFNPFHLNAEELNRMAQSLLNQQQRVLLQPSSPLPQISCLVCSQPFPSQPALLLHMAMHINQGNQLFPSNVSSFNLRSENKQELRSPLSVMASLPNQGHENEDVATPSITDSATSSSCPNSPQKTSPIEIGRSRSSSPLLISLSSNQQDALSNTNHSQDNKCCMECVRQRARTEELEGEVQRHRETIRNTRHLLDQMSLMASQLGGCSPFDPSFAIQTKTVFQKIQSALQNVECQ